MTEDDAQPNDRPRQRRDDGIMGWVRRWSIDFSALIAMLVSIAGASQIFGWDFPPWVTTRAYAGDQMIIQQQFDQVKGQIGRLNTTVLQSQELQLESRLDALLVELARLPQEESNSTIRNLLNSQRIEVEQKLAVVRAELRGVP